MPSLKVQKEASPTNPELWKEIWWTKYVTVIAVYILCYYCWRLLQKIMMVIMLIMSNPRRDEYDNANENDERLEPEIKTQDRPQNHSDENPNFSEFHDLTDHGIQFYDYDCREGTMGRKRRSRMHSTVTESSLASMVKKRRSSVPAMAAPPFPKMEMSPQDEEVDRAMMPSFSHQIGKELQSSGDARPANHGRRSRCPGQLGTVPEEEGLLENKSVRGSQHVGVNTEFTLGHPSPSHLVLHQFPSTDSGPNVADAQSFENYLRSLNISFTVQYDCSTGPWISHEGKRIEGVLNCMNYLKEKFPNEEDLHLESVIDSSPPEITIAPYYPITSLDEKEKYDPKDDLHCSPCHSKVSYCTVCQNYSAIVLADEGGGNSKIKTENSIPEDLYIDDNLEDITLVGQE